MKRRPYRFATLLVGITRSVTRSFGINNFNVTTYSAPKYVNTIDRIRSIVRKDDLRVHSELVKSSKIGPGRIPGPVYSASSFRVST